MKPLDSPIVRKWVDDITLRQVNRAYGGCLVAVVLWGVGLLNVSWVVLVSILAIIATVSLLATLVLVAVQSRVLVYRYGKRVANGGAR